MVLKELDELEWTGIDLNGLKWTVFDQSLSGWAKMDLKQWNGAE